MGKIRSNFTLSNDTLELLSGVDNKSETVEKAVKFYFANKDRPFPQERSKLRLKEVVA